MNCNPLLLLKMNQDKLKAMFPHASASMLKRNLEFAPDVAQAGHPGYDVPSSLRVATKLKQQNKYRNIKVEYEGMKFDSKHELKCWQNLKLREKAGEIKELKRQVKYALNWINGVKIGRFTADFAWVENGKLVVADAKSEITRKETAYRLRKKIFEAQYAPLVIREL